MIHGPIDLSSYKSVEIYYSQNYAIEDGDWLGFCAISSANVATPSSFTDDDCFWQSGDRTDGWENEYEDLSLWAGKSNVYVAFVFQSDSSSAANYAGPFIDEVEIWANGQDVDPTDPNNEFVDWADLAAISFSATNLASAPWKLSATPASAVWSTTTAKADTGLNSVYRVRLRSQNHRDDIGQGSLLCEPGGCERSYEVAGHDDVSRRRPHPRLRQRRQNL